MEQNNTDWKPILGFSLIFAIVMYLMWDNDMAQPDQAVEAEKEQTVQTQDSVQPTADTSQNDSIVQTRQKVVDTGVFKSTGAAEDITFENDLLEFTISTQGARITEARVKDFDTYKGEPVYIIKDGNHDFNLEFRTADGRTINTRDLVFEPSQETNGDNKVLSLKAKTGPQQFLELRYELDPDDYMMDFTIRSQGLSSVFNTSEAPELNWNLKAYRHAKSLSYENRYTKIVFEYDGGSDDYTGQGEVATEQESDITYIAYKQHFFAAILLSGTPLPSATMTSVNIAEQDEDQETYTKEFKTDAELAYTGGELLYKMDWYFGPSDYQILNNYDRNLDEVMPLGWGIFGWINKFVFIPVFNFLGSFLPYGIAIIVLTILVRLVLSPVLYKSYLAQAKMKILRPEINKVAEKYKDNAMKKQQETMRIQSEAGASPLSGCLPALLQLPVFYALFQFFPSAFVLRQKSFLWAEDLSSYDTIYQFPDGFSIPFYGDHISLFPILASVAIFFYMQLTTGQSMQQQQPGMPNMKFLLYLSPVIMLFFFNNYASGLSLYYLTSNLITIGIMLVIKNYIIDEKKVLAKIETARAKPKKKKGKFSRKMAEIMEQAQKAKEEQERKKK